ncbi:polymer-forming cytoskeletal protein [Kiloniella sp. EL199]|uniref:bactofilin family protein n=1 Tax=Kiloniella sp. EL199 TaxID=2107581 RepID=UPI0013C41D27|nr:polymer-forming cytoskeletal protein [Kiloniella sp. EL199]
MFSKSSKTNTKVAAPSDTPKKIAPSGIPSILSPDLSLVGDLTSTGDLQIDGNVQGDIICHAVTIGEKAVVTGSVKADEVRVCGMVSGQLNADTITLASTAKVVGDILHKSIAIEAGAQVEGQFRRISDKAEQPVSSTVSALPETETAKIASPAAVNSGAINAVENASEGSSSSTTQSTDSQESSAAGSSASTVPLTEVKSEEKPEEKKSSIYGASSSWNSSN